MDILKRWFIASRAPFSITLIIPGILGIIAAWNKGMISIMDGVMTITGLLFANLGTNFANDYFDYRSGVDSIDKGRVYKQGSEILLSTGLSPLVVLASSFTCFALSAAMGIILAFRVDMVLLPLTFVFIALGFFYTAPPLKFGYRGLGEVVSGFASGPIAVVGAYFVQTHRVTPEIWLLSIPSGLLVAAILYIGNVPDADADRQVGKRTLSVRFGRRAVKLLGPLFYVFVYGSILVSVMLGFITAWALIAFLTVPMVFKLIKHTSSNYNNIELYAPSIMLTVNIFALTTLLIIGGYVIQHFSYLI